MAERGARERFALVGAGVRGRCPRCRRGHALVGLLGVAPRCEVCGLDYAFADAGDGAAVFVTLIAGFVVLGVALWVDLTFDPPLWMFVVVFLPVTVVVCLALLRPFKGLLIALQYELNAEQGRFEP